MPTEALRPADIRSAIIEKVRNGWIVKVGCETFVSQSWKEISEGLDLYWKDPQKAYEKYVYADIDTA
jgi:hypothetical protein